MQRVNARTSAWLSVTFRDRQNIPQVPASATYRIDCLTTKRAIRGVTTITPGFAAVDLQLTADDTAIVNRNDPTELRRVTVVAQYTSAQDQVTGQYDFEVVNLPFV